MVPGRCLCGSAVFAAIAMLAPSRAARRAIASPMPRLAPVMNSVLPERLMGIGASLSASDFRIPDHAGGVRDSRCASPHDQAVQVGERLAGGHAEQFGADRAREKGAEDVD